MWGQCSCFFFLFLFLFSFFKIHLFLPLNSVLPFRGDETDCSKVRMLHHCDDVSLPYSTDRQSDYSGQMDTLIAKLFIVTVCANFDLEWTPLPKIDVFFCDLDFMFHWCSSNLDFYWITFMEKIKLNVEKHWISLLLSLY